MNRFYKNALTAIFVVSTLAILISKGAFSFWKPALPSRELVSIFNAFFENLMTGNLFPVWSSKLNLGFGSPVFAFLEPAPLYLWSLVYLINKNADQSYSLLMYFLMGLKISGFFLLTRTWLRQARLLPICFENSWILPTIVTIGIAATPFENNLHSALFFAIIPWVALSQLLHFKKFELKYFLMSAAFSCFLALTDRTLYFTTAITSVLLFTIYSKRKNSFWIPVGINFSAALLGLFHLLPALIERKSSYATSLLATLPPQLPTQSLIIFTPALLVMLFLSIKSVLQQRLLSSTVLLLGVFIASAFLAKTNSSTLAYYKPFAFHFSLILGLMLYAYQWAHHPKDSAYGTGLAAVTLGIGFLFVNTQPQLIENSKPLSYFPNTVQTQPISGPESLLLFLKGRGEASCLPSSPTLFSCEIMSIQKSSIEFAQFYSPLPGPHWKAFSSEPITLSANSTRGTVQFELIPGKYQIRFQLINSKTRFFAKLISIGSFLIWLTLLLQNQVFKRKSSRQNRKENLDRRPFYEASV